MLNLNLNNNVEVLRRFPKTTKVKRVKPKNYNEFKVIKRDDLDEAGMIINDSIANNFQFHDRVQEKLRQNLSALKEKQNIKMGLPIKKPSKSMNRKNSISTTSSVISPSNIASNLELYKKATFRNGLNRSKLQINIPKKVPGDIDNANKS